MLDVAILLLLIIFLMSVAMPKFKVMQQLVDRLNLVSREILTGIMPVRAFSREKFEEQRFDKANRELMGTQLFTNRAMVAMMPFMTLIMNGTSLLIVWFGGKAMDAGTMQVGESKGEGRDRRVVIYSTAPDAQTENTYGERRGRGGNRNGRRPGGNRNGGYRGERRSNGGYRGNRSGAPRGPRPSSVPERTYAPRDAESAAPVAPKRTERVDDFADFSFGKIEL